MAAAVRTRRRMTTIRPPIGRAPSFETCFIVDLSLSDDLVPSPAYNVGAPCVREGENILGVGEISASRVSGCPGSGRIVDAWRRIRILNANLTLEAVRIAEEDTEHGPKVGDEVIGCLPGHQPLPNRLEGFERRGSGPPDDRGALARTSASGGRLLYCRRSGTR